MKRKKLCGFLILIFVMVIGLSLVAPLGVEAASIKPEKSKIKLGLPVITYTFLPLYLAVEQGLFKEDGLEVELVAFRGGSDLIKGIVSDSVDAGLTSLAGVALGIRAKQKLKAFYAGYNMPSFDWYGLPKYKTIADTKGAKYGVSRFGSSTDFLTRYALLSNGLDPTKDVQILQGGRSATRLAAMEAGQLDVNVFAAPEKFISQDKGYNLIIRQRDLADDYPFHTYFAKEAFIKNNPNVIKAILRGNIKGIRLMRSNKALALKTLGKRIKMDKKYLERTYNDFADFIFEDGRLPSKEGMDVFFKMGIMSGTFKEKWPQEKYFDSTYVDSYNQWKP